MCAWSGAAGMFDAQVEAGDLLHEGHSSSQGLTVAVIYHGYTDS